MLGVVVMTQSAVNECVFVTGTVCDFRLNYGRVLSRKSHVIAINRNKQQLHKVLSLRSLAACNHARSCN